MKCNPEEDTPIITTSVFSCSDAEVRQDSQAGL